MLGRIGWVWAALIAAGVSSGSVSAEAVERGGPGLPEYYLTVPIEGRIGEEALAEGVERALDFASRRGVEHILFHIDTPGGAVSEAERIAAMMRERSGEFTYYALLRRAMSAGMFVVFSCDHVFVEPDAAAGAALSYRIGAGTGSPELDAKFNSAMAARLAAIAEANGHDARLARAMVLPELELHALPDAEGDRLVVLDAPPVRSDDRESEGEGQDGVVLLSGAGSVLALTAAEAVRIGFARAWEERAVLRGEDWREVGRHGHAAMERARRDAERRERERERLLGRIKERMLVLEVLVEDAERIDPRAHSDYRTNLQTGRLAPHSRRLWQSRTDAAVETWSAVREGIRRVRGQIRRLGEDGLERETSADLRALEARSAREIDRLLRERDRR